MPDGTNNIYLDSTFTSTNDGYGGVDSEVEFVDADNIGNYDIPMVYQTTVSLIGKIDHNIEYFANYISISGTDNVPLSFFRELSSDFGVTPSIIDYNVGNVISGTCDNYIAYLTGYNVVSGTVTEKITYIAGEQYGSFKSFLVEHNCGSVISGSNSYWQVYMNYSGYVDINGFPIPAIYAQKDIITEYGTSVHNTGGVDSDVDITFAGWVNFPILSDIYSVDAGITDAYFLDVQTISGCVTPLYSDMYSSQLVTSGINFDIYCSLMSMAVMNSDVELIDGRVGYVKQEVYSTVVGIPTISCDIDLYPLKITNFSLDIGEFTTASGYISVDILDDVYGVSISGTYLKVEDQTVSVTFSGIDNGYRMFYDPVDDFSNLNGPTVFTVHAENNNENILEENFYLTFGYIVEYDNKPRIGVDFDYNTKVTVRVTAENYASCPKLTSDGHRFITEHRENVDLGATIVGMFHADDVSNLSAEIYPKSTAYFYGKEFTVVIKAKDFANNVMEPVTLRYRIEDEPV